MSFLLLGVCHSALAQVKGFAGADIGVTRDNLALDSVSGDYDTYSNGGSFNVGYWINQHVAIKLGYIDFGSADLSDLNYYDSNISVENSVEAKGFLMGVVLSSPVSDGPFRYFSEIGLHRIHSIWSLDVKQGDTTFRVNAIDSTSIDVWFGIGFAYAVFDHLEATFAADWYMMNPKLTDAAQYATSASKADVRLNRYSLGLNYQF